MHESRVDKPAGADTVRYLLQVSVDRALRVQEAQEGNIHGGSKLWGETIQGASCGASLDHALALAGGTDP